MPETLNSPEKIQYAIDQVKANLAIEGLYATPEHEMLWRNYLEGKLSFDKMLAKANELFI